MFEDKASFIRVSSHKRFKDEVCEMRREYRWASASVRRTEIKTIAFPRKENAELWRVGVHAVLMRFLNAFEDFALGFSPQLWERGRGGDSARALARLTR